MSNDDPEFAKMPTQRIDELGTLAHEALVRSKRHRSGLMFSALDLDIMHVRSLCSLRDRRRIVLLSFDERLHIDRRN